ncbi:MAG: NAD(P)-dependent oxidoreductase, partial [Pseudomonadota bacterium]|nr:NAD(P)-dependent oxidoreductase [Pseudomonadota bacterium]
MRSGAWPAFEGVELRGKTLGIVGTGAVGAELCRSAAGFGMNCIAWNRSGGASSLPCKEVPHKQVFRDADALSLHIAFSDTTNKMIGAPFLQSMKPGAILVNTTRGGLVDDVALVEALKTGPLGHAALDVYTVEPLKSGSPLRSAECHP